MLVVFSTLLSLLPVVPPVDAPDAAAVEVRWDGPATCPGVDEVRRRIADAVLSPTGVGTLVVVGEVQPVPAGFRLRLRTAYEGSEDTWTIDDADCDALADAAALVAAVSLAPAADSAKPERTPDPEALPEPRLAPEPQLEEPQSAARLEPRHRPVQPSRATRAAAMTLGMGPQVEFGALPGLSAGPRISLGVLWRRASVATYGWYGASRPTDRVEGVSGVVGMGAAGLRGCLRLHSGQLSVPFCGLAEAGAIRMESRGAAPRNVLSFPWWAVGVRAGVERRWKRVAVFGASELVVPLRRARAVVNRTVVFETRAASVRVLVGIRTFFGGTPQNPSEPDMSES